MVPEDLTPEEREFIFRTGKTHAANCSQATPSAAPLGRRRTSPACHFPTRRQTLRSLAAKAAWTILGDHTV